MNYKGAAKSSEQKYYAPNSMSTYLKEIDAIPLLSREEEQELTSNFGTCCQVYLRENPAYQLCSTCTAIKEKLIISNLRFVVSVAKKYQGNNLSLADLINEGNLGLLMAVDKFDHTLGYHFISYAVWWIKQSIMKAISEKSRMIRLPMNRTNELFRIAKFIDKYSKEFGTKPSEALIEKELGINKTEIKRILDLASGHTALEELVTDDGEFDSFHINVPEFQSPEHNIIQLSLSNNIHRLLDFLSERERFILMKRFGLDGGDCLSLSKIGELLGLTKERVRQLEKQALEQIKAIAQENQMTLYFH